VEGPTETPKVTKNLPLCCFFCHTIVIFFNTVAIKVHYVDDMEWKVIASKCSFSIPTGSTVGIVLAIYFDDSQII